MFSDRIYNGVQYSDILSETRVETDILSVVRIITFIPQIQQQPNWFKPFKLTDQSSIWIPNVLFFHTH